MGALEDKVNDEADALEGKALNEYEDMMNEKDKLLGDDKIVYDDTPPHPNII